MMAAINSHAGSPHSSTLRNPGWYTARISTIARNIQTMTSLTGCHVAIRIAGDLMVDGRHRWRGRQLIGWTAHLLQDHLLLKRRQRLRCTAGQKKSEQGERFHRIDSRPMGRNASIAHSLLRVQNGVTL